MEKFYVAALNAVNLLGNKRVQRLTDFFGGAEKAWRAESADLKKSGLPERVLTSLMDFKEQHPDAVEKLQEFCAAKRLDLCSFYDENYPPILKEIPNPPIVFYYRGKIIPDAERIAIVGTRKATGYGEKITMEISGELAAAGFTIVSGMARGIDRIAHRAALKSGRTIAVLGFGFGQNLSREDKKLIDEIAESGVVMSEFPPSVGGSRDTFPIRNRVIAGLSRGTIVVEAGVKSGALITSTYAGEFGRDVFAVPGSVYSDLSVGCHELIRDGVTLIKNADDVLEAYNLIDRKSAPAEAKENLVAERAALDVNEKRVYDLVPIGDFITADEILNLLDDIGFDEISEIMTHLELKKYIVEDSDRYTRI